MTSLNKQHIEEARKIAQLESKIDFLEAELSFLNEILMKIGFPEGITTLKESALELLEESLENPDSDDGFEKIS